MLNNILRLAFLLLSLTASLFSQTTVTSPNSSFTTASVIVTGNCNTSQTGCSGAVGAVRAFPTASGGGAQSVGGRGGRVYEVTKLDDSGPNTLRECAQASGPRTCVFRVSGLITFLSRVQISSPFLTIAGQTAPGGGIVIGGPNQRGEQLFITTHDIIVRYLTYDGNNPNTPTGPDSGTVCCEMASGQVYNIMWDHISSRWAGNKAFPTNPNGAGLFVRNVTEQWILMYEPNSCHPVGFGLLYVSAGTDTDTTDDDVHHSLFANVGHRLPLNQSGLNTRNVNNIVYNYGQFAVLSMGGVHGDFIKNKYVDGTSDSAGLRTAVCSGVSYPNGNAVNYGDVHTFIGEVGNVGDDPTGNPGGNNEGPPSFYLRGNIGRNGASYRAAPIVPTDVANDAGQKAMTNQGYEGGDRGGAMPSGWFRGTPNPTLPFPIPEDDVNALDNVLPSYVGNWAHLDCNGNYVSNRDSQDARVVQQYKNRAGGNTFFGQFSAPSIPGGSACQESNRDGVPDQWKSTHGVSQGTNAATSFTRSGYTILEHYLNGTDPNASN